VARLDASSTIASGYPKPLDGERIHQGDASLAGTGCDLAVAYTLGDPNGKTKIAVKRVP
jgi:hypothetical protein